LADRAKGFVMVGKEHFEALLNRFIGHRLLHRSSVPLGFPTQDAPNGGLWHAKSGSADPSNHNDADLQGTGGTRGASREVGLRSSRPTQSAAKRSATSARI
jgi:hypothetical protein